MPGPVTFLSLSLTWFLAILASLLFYALLTGRIVARGILHESDQHGIAADRVQLLAASLSGASAYVIYALQHLGESRLPEIPARYLAIAASSQGLYLIFKVMRRLGRL